MRQTPCRITAIFFRAAGTFLRLLHMQGRRPSRQIDILPFIFNQIAKKIAIRLKALFAAPLSPFEAASSLMAAT